MSDTPYCTCGTAMNDDDYCEVHSPLAERDATIERLTAQVAVLREAVNTTWGMVVAVEPTKERYADAYLKMQAALADPNPEAERLVAERDAGRALYKAATASTDGKLDLGPPFFAAVEAYRRLVEETALAAINDAVKEGE